MKTKLSKTNERLFIALLSLAGGMLITVVLRPGYDDRDVREMVVALATAQGYTMIKEPGYKYTIPSHWKASNVPNTLKMGTVTNGITTSTCTTSNGNVVTRCK